MQRSALFICDRDDQCCGSAVELLLLFAAVLKEKTPAAFVGDDTSLVPFSPTVFAFLLLLLSEVSVGDGSGDRDRLLLVADENIVGQGLCSVDFCVVNASLVCTADG